MVRQKPIRKLASPVYKHAARRHSPNTPEIIIDYSGQKVLKLWLKDHYKLLSRGADKLLIKIGLAKSLAQWPRSYQRELRSRSATIFPPVPRPHFRAASYLMLSLFITTAIVLGSVVTYFYVFADLPEPSELTQQQQNLTTTILDRNGQVLYQIYEDQNRKLVPLDQVSPYLTEATISIEDQNFYQHHGLDFKGIARALVADITGKSIQQGGSTITQQLAKNRLFGPEPTLRRKLREAVEAILIEKAYSKHDILEMYLNSIAYGGSTYGIEAAAQKYFGVSAHNLDLAQASFLAGLPQAPSEYNPFGPTPELGKNRQAEVLQRMVDDKDITADQATTAENEKLAFITDTIPIQAPHFVMYVRDLLAQQYGEDTVNKGGLIVRTSLDLNLQNQAQQQLTAEVKKINRLHITNGAATITNPQTGEVLAMIGSTDYFDTAHDGEVNVTTSLRQPGSSIKPLTYALAFSQGFTPATLIDDEPVSFPIPGSAPYTPKNYDGKWHGEVPLRIALASSYNIPAVKLLNAIGVNTMLNKAQEVGISTWTDRSRFGLSLTLGAGEVRMIDMNELYGTFANGGVTVPINPILSVTDQQGSVIYHNTCALDHQNCQGHQSFSPQVAYQITNVLSDNAARTPAFGPQSVLYIPGQDVAVKTGTTNSEKDNWTIGYTNDRVVATWVGNNDDTPMSYVASGITGASPIWNDLMRLTLDPNNPNHFTQPDGLIKVAVCEKSDTLSCGDCPDKKDEYFIPGTEPKNSCDTQNQVTYQPPIDFKTTGDEVEKHTERSNSVNITQTN